MSRAAHAPARLPAPCAKPCGECPWLTDAAPGWLGPHDAQGWLDIARSEAPVACHSTLEGRKGWKGSRVRQCRGLGAFRRNICKSPRNSEDAANDPESNAFRTQVFKTPADFLAHHAALPKETQ